MNKSNIEWCDYTWNPVTGCFHGCSYCYADRIARRFALAEYQCGNCRISPDCPGKGKAGKCPEFRKYMPSEKLHILDARQYVFYPKKRYIAFPFGFEPTLHRYRMQDPGKTKKASRIFVCSMADLFGAWIPESWILEVFAECSRYPQHRYMFLTKNPGRYKELAAAGKLPTDENMLYGTIVENDSQDYFHFEGYNSFVEKLIQEEADNG